MDRDFLRGRNFWLSLAAVVIFILIVISAVSGWIVEWLWMSQLGYEAIFWSLLSAKLALFGIAFVSVFLYFWLNLRSVFSTRSRLMTGQAPEAAGEGNIVLAPGAARALSLGISSFLALVFGLIYYSQWDTYLRFRWGGSFGEADPLYGLDIGFYVFRLPFYELIQNGLVGLTLVGLLVTFLAYLNTGNLSHRPIIRHLSFNFLFFLGAWGWGYYLDRYELLYSTRGVVYGVGYTDYNVVKLGLWIMLAASIALGVFLIINLFLRRLGTIRIGIAGYFGLIVVLLVILPAAVQEFRVEPNELELEAPYLRHNIGFTRRAYMLDRIQERDYPALADLTLDEVSKNKDTIRNVRLWDWRPIRQTFRQTQEIRLYYKFYEVDVGRYHLGEDGYRQVMLSSRELREELPPKAATWVNQRLQYTHGYGLAMSLVSEKAEEGLPRYVIKDLPPASTQLSVDRPAVYYGEMMPGYRIVNSKVKELDYPRGDENVYTSYEGRGGILVGGIWKRLLFAWTLSDINILLTSYIKPESRIQLWRQVGERVRKVAPFLKLDDDPYLVLSGGKLYWIQDAYTISPNFPYSEPYRGELNYIRNSVKVVVDAYQGSVEFYVMEPDEPVLGAYRRAFPGVFEQLAEMPRDLREHLRYPEDLFNIQVGKFLSYHMTIPQVFYNQEDLWTRPQEKYAGSPIQMEPYYILMRLPGEEKLQYLMMTPLNPENRDNMIAWIAAKSDFPEYGQVVVYKLPKERLIYGPVQIEAVIDQDDVISQQLSLWDQRGSKVIRGNLLVIPLDHSFIYVEPVYLVAEQIDIPQLKRVIVVYGKKVAMEPTLEQALESVFGARRPKEEEAPPAVGEDVLQRFRDKFKKMEEAMSRGEWAEFGEAMQTLREMLREQSAGGR